MNKAVLLGYFGLSILVFQGCSESSSPSVPPVAQPFPLSLTVASQDRSLFVSWYADDPFLDRKSEQFYVLEGKDSEGHTVLRECPNHGGCLLTGLENDVLWQVSLREMIGDKVSREARSAGTPRSRAQYAYFNYASDFIPNFHIFTSWDAADSWLRTNRIEATDLRYRGQAVGNWSRDIRNGIYTYGESPTYAFLLSRDLDGQFNADQSLRNLDEVRPIFRRIVWQADPSPSGVTPPYIESEGIALYNLVIDSPLTKGCKVTKAKLRSASNDPDSTIVHLIQCTRTIKRGLAIYLEGHAGSGLEQGTDMWAYLANLGWDILLIDMPMSGFNYLDSVPGYHFSYPINDVGGRLPIARFLDPIKLGIDWVLMRSSSPPSRLITIGRSGGGWASILYSCFDERIEYAIAIAGLIPMSTRLAKDAPNDAGDYEQFAPALFSQLPYEQLMLAAGTRGSFYIYNENDPCCFQVHPDNPFLTFLQDSAHTHKRQIGFYIDPMNMNHSASIPALVAMRIFIQDLPL